MEFTLTLPDSMFDNDPDYPRFVGALQAMLNRMAFSHHKYGPMGVSQTIGDVDAILTARQRMTMYDGLNLGDSCDCGFLDEEHGVHCFLVRKRSSLNTGNTENLLDSANCLIIEHLYPRHPKAHFKPQDTDESPGLARQ